MQAYVFTCNVWFEALALETKGDYITNENFSRTKFEMFFVSEFSLVTASTA